jgi:hypothetical protein
MKNELTIADVIIEAMPFSDEIVAWCIAHPEFKEALKVTNADRFLALGMVQTSYPRTVPQDYVIGFTAYDYIDEIFKQDFIVDVGSQHKVFVLYSKLPSKNYGKYVQSITGFYAKYGKNGDYANTHHPTIQQIEGLQNPELTERANDSIAKGKQIKQSGRRQVSQAELQETLAKIRLARRQGLLT